MAEPHYLWAYGLVLSLPVRVRALRIAPPGARVGATVLYGAVTNDLADAVASDDLAELGWRRTIDGDGRVLWTTRHARYLIENGTTIVIDRDADSRCDMVFVLAFALPALLMQRGTLVLHATTVARNGAALCIVGESGAGKSTLAAELLRRGLRLVSDDVTALDLAATGAVQALPGHSRYSLHETTQARMRAPTTRTWRIPGPRGKVALWAPPEACAEEPQRLAAVVVLRHGEPGTKLEIEALSGVAKAQAVLGNAYLPMLLTLRRDSFPVLPKLLSDVPIVEVQRPDDAWTVDELADTALVLLER